MVFGFDRSLWGAPTKTSLLAYDFHLDAMLQVIIEQRNAAFVQRDAIQRDSRPEHVGRRLRDADGVKPTVLEFTTITLFRRRLRVWPEMQ